MDKNPRLNLFPSLKETVKAAFHFFKKRTQNTTTYVFLIFLLLSLKTTVDVAEKDLSKRIGGKTQKDEYYCIMVSYMILKFMWWSISFISKIVLEVLITPIGGIMCSYVLGNIFHSERQRGTHLSPLQTEYFLTEGSKAIAKTIRLIFVDFLENVFSIVGNFIYIFREDKSNFKSSSLAFMLLIFFIAVFRLINMTQSFLILLEVSRADCHKEEYFVETVDSIKIVKSYNESKKHVSRYNDALIKWETLITKSKFISLSNLLFYNISVEFLILMATLIFASSAYTNPDVDLTHTDSGQDTVNASQIAIINSIGIFSKVLKYIPSSFTLVLKFYQDVAEAVSLSKNFMNLTNFIREDASKKIRIDKFNDKIEVKNIDFSISGKAVLTNASFTVKKGSKNAVYGRNGTGKSSIAKILLGLEEYHGQVLVDGIELSHICMEDYRKLIAYVPQETKLFNESIYYNLSFGNNCSYATIVEECKRMRIHDIIMTFPAGYNTVVGAFGNNINGGLRQEIFYTRAFLSGAEFYIFDEPSNNLDEVHSQFILEYIKDPSYSDKTFLIICHDRDIVNQFPTIFKFQDGKVALEKDMFLENNLSIEKTQ